MARWLAPLLALPLSPVACAPTDWGANALLKVARRPPVVIAQPHEKLEFTTYDGLTLRGVLLRSAAPRRRGLILYLHGHTDNLRGVVGLAQRFLPLGFDLLAYDSRAHGSSDGHYCTFGWHEKRDVQSALDAVRAERAILFGCSLGGAVALQTAAIDARVLAVIAQAPYASLELIVRQRAPWFASEADLQDVMRVAQARGGFQLAEVSPERDAARIHVPVLLIHGELDSGTPPEHSRRIDQRLAGPHRLLMVPGKGHLGTLDGEPVWQAILSFVESAGAPGV